MKDEEQRIEALRAARLAKIRARLAEVRVNPPVPHLQQRDHLEVGLLVEDGRPDGTSDGLALVRDVPGEPRVPEQLLEVLRGPFASRTRSTS